MKYLLITLVFVATLAKGQSVTNENKFYWTGTVQLDSTPKSEVFNHAKAAISKVFATTKSTTEISDAESGTLVIKGYMASKAVNAEGTVVDDGTVSYTLTVFCKDNKYRYILNDLMDMGNGVIHKSPYASLLKDTSESALMTKDIWNNTFKPYVKENCNKVVRDLIKEMTAKK